MILSYEDIEHIAAAVLEDFESTIPSNLICTRGLPVETLATTYLGMIVKYARLSNGVIGVTAYDDVECIITEGGVTRTISLKRNDILLDISLAQPSENAAAMHCRRFTLAHECAHQILFQLENQEVKSACRSRYEFGKAYSLRALKFREDWNEWQANALGASMLMPKEQLSAAAQKLCRGHVLTDYAGRLTARDKLILEHLCHIFNVSMTAMRIRLKNLNLLVNKQFSEFCDPSEVCA